MRTPLRRLSIFRGLRGNSADSASRARRALPASGDVAPAERRKPRRRSAGGAARLRTRGAASGVALRPQARGAQRRGIPQRGGRIRQRVRPAPGGFWWDAPNRCTTGRSSLRTRTASGVRLGGLGTCRRRLRGVGCGRDKRKPGEGLAETGAQPHHSHPFSSGFVPFGVAVALGGLEPTWPNSRDPETRSPRSQGASRNAGGDPPPVLEPRGTPDPDFGALLVHRGPLQSRPPRCTQSWRMPPEKSHGQRHTYSLEGLRIPAIDRIAATVGAPSKSVHVPRACPIVSCTPTGCRTVAAPSGSWTFAPRRLAQRTRQR